jgi:beta-lactam-binding protein with PASTA domain
MAATSEAPASGKGFNLGKPGLKEYLIVGGIALGGAVLYFWWKNKTSAASANDTGSTANDSANAPSTPTGLSTGQFLSWIQDHTSSTTTTTAPTTGTAAGGKVAVPPLVGSRAETAVDALDSKGLTGSLSEQTPKGKTGTITAQSPKAGSVVARGSTVRLTNKVT